MKKTIAILLSLVIALGFWVFPQETEEATLGSTNNGRDKYKLSAGESFTWTWMPEVKNTAEIIIIEVIFITCATETILYHPIRVIQR